MNVFELGVSPDDSALVAGRRRLFTAVLIFGFLPNIPLVMIGIGGMGSPILLAVVLIHLAVLCGMLFAQHRRFPTATVASIGILWTLCYVVFLEITIGGGRGGTALVVYALLILAYVLLVDSRGWLRQLTIGATWVTAALLWFADLAHLDEAPLSLWLLRLASFIAFPTLVLVILAWYRRASRDILEETVLQSVEIEGLLRVAELGQVASGISHALAQPISTATARLDLAIERMSASGESGTIDPSLLVARQAMTNLVSVVRQLDTRSGKESHETSADCSVTECLDHVRALTLSRVRHTNLHVDRDRISPDARLPVDLPVGTRLMYTLLTSGSEFLRHHSNMKPRLSLATEGRDGHTVVSMTLGSDRTESRDTGERRLIDLEQDGPLKSLALLSREKGWACSAYERFEAATGRRYAVAPTYAVVSVEVTPMTTMQGP